MTTIAQERQQLALIDYSDLRQRQQWGASSDYTSTRTVDEPADHQFVHITVTNPGNYSSNDAHARAIEAIGISRFGATVGCSYNRGFMLDAAAYELQPIGRRGAHTVNDKQLSTCATSGCPDKGRSLRTQTDSPAWNLNYNARAYAVCGNVDDPIGDQLLDRIARALAADRLAGFVKPDATLHGHRCCSAKSCPGDRVWARMAQLRTRMEHYLANGLTDMKLTDTFTLGTGGPAEETVSVATALGRAAYAYHVTLSMSARLGALESAVALLAAAPAGPLTVEEVQAAAKAGAEQALAEGVDLRVTVDDQETPSP